MKFLREIWEALTFDHVGAIARCERQLWQLQQNACDREIRALRADRIARTHRRRPVREAR